MLSDEEKKALERIDYIQDFIIENGQYNADVNDMGYFSKILNLIEKQQKEIEELKEQCKEVVCIPEGTCFMLEPKDVNKKWEDKIKAKIEEVSNGTYDAKIVLQSLLEKE